MASSSVFAVATEADLEDSLAFEAVGRSGHMSTERERQENQDAGEGGISSAGFVGNAGTGSVKAHAGCSICGTDAPSIRPSTIRDLAWHAVSEVVIVGDDQGGHAALLVEFDEQGVDLVGRWRCPGFLSARPARRSRGRGIRARASATRCCSPPDSSPGR